MENRGLENDEPNSSAEINGHDGFSSDPIILPDLLFDPLFPNHAFSVSPPPIIAEATECKRM